MLMKPGIYGPTQGLHAYYTMGTDYIDGTTLVDSTTNNHNGLIVGALTGQGGYIGEAFYFDGVDDEVVPNSVGISGDTSVTIAAWVNVATDATGGNGIYGFGVPGVDNQSCAIRTNSETSWRFYFWGNDLVVTGAPYYGTWTHIAGVYDASGPARRVYQDGTLIGSDTPATPNMQDTGHSIGQYAGHEFRGLIDEIRIYNRALTDTDIQTLAGQ